MSEGQVFVHAIEKKIIYDLLQIQYDDVNQGRCGECGDIWSDPRPRPNDEGGLYGTGTIGKVYQQAQVSEMLFECLPIFFEI